MTEWTGKTRKSQKEYGSDLKLPPRSREDTAKLADLANELSKLEFRPRKHNEQDSLHSFNLITQDEAVDFIARAGELGLKMSAKKVSSDSDRNQSLRITDKKSYLEITRAGLEYPGSHITKQLIDEWDKIFSHPEPER